MSKQRLQRTARSQNQVRARELSNLADRLEVPTALLRPLELQRRCSTHPSSASLPGETEN